jgi:hypothetical protein
MKKRVGMCTLAGAIAVGSANALAWSNQGHEFVCNMPYGPFTGAAKHRRRRHASDQLAKFNPFRLRPSNLS